MKDDFDYAEAQAGAARGETYYSFPSAPNIRRDHVVMLVIFPAYGEDDPGMEEVLVDHGTIDGGKWMMIALIGKIGDVPDMLMFQDRKILTSYRYHASQSALVPMAGNTLAQLASHAMGIRQPGEDPAAEDGMRTAIDGQSALSMKGHVMERLPGSEMVDRYLFALKVCICVNALLGLVVMARIIPGTLPMTIGVLASGAVVGAYPVIAARFRNELRDLFRLPDGFMAHRERILQHVRTSCALLLASSLGIMVAGLVPA